jgi:hypothetical protein
MKLVLVLVLLAISLSATSVMAEVIPFHSTGSFTTINPCNPQETINFTIDVTGTYSYGRAPRGYEYFIHSRFQAVGVSSEGDRFLLRGGENTNVHFRSLNQNVSQRIISLGGSENWALRIQTKITLTPSGALAVGFTNVTAVCRGKVKRSSHTTEAQSSRE